MEKEMVFIVVVFMNFWGRLQVGSLQRHNLKWTSIPISIRLESVYNLGGISLKESGFNTELLKYYIITHKG